MEGSRLIEVGLDFYLQLLENAQRILIYLIILIQDL